jgi:hypothetical protein
MSNDQEVERVQQIRRSLQNHDTQSLLNIWKANNRREWTPEAFDAIHEILLDRLGNVPPQKNRDPREAIPPQEGRQRFFLTGFEGRIEFQYLSAKDARHIFHRIRGALSAQQATDIHGAESEITFRVSMLRFASNWNVLTPVDEGEINIYPGSPGVVKYRFSFTRMFIFATISAAFFFIMLSPTLGSNTFVVIAIPIIAWLFLFGLNYIIAVFRLQDFVWQAISG